MNLSDAILDLSPRRDKLYKMYDGQGLFVEVPPTGNIRWRYKYTLNKKEKRLSLGTYPQISTDKARELRDELKKQLVTGVDPSTQRKTEKQSVSPHPLEDLSREDLLSKVLIYRSMVNELRDMLLEIRGCA